MFSPPKNRGNNLGCDQAFRIQAAHSLERKDLTRCEYPTAKREPRQEPRHPRILARNHDSKNPLMAE